MTRKLPDTMRDLHRPHPAPRTAAKVFLALYGVVLLAATLVPVQGALPVTCVALVVCGSRGVADIVLNVAMFVPWGAGLRVAGLAETRRGAGLAAATFSTGIEFAQFLVPGRHPSGGDILFNGLGGVLGAAAAAALASLVTDPARSARRYGPWWAALAAGTLLGGGLLLAPAFPRTVWYGQWTPDLGHLERYEGMVLDAKIGEEDVPNGRHPASGTLRAGLQAEHPIAVDFVAGPPPSRLAPVFSIFDDAQSEVLVVGAEGGTLVLRFARVASRLRLSNPELRFPIPASIAPGDTVRLRIARADGRVAVRIDEGPIGDDAFTVARTWAVLMPLDRVPRGVKRWIDALWLLALTAPLGYFARAARVGRATLFWVAPVTAVALLPPRLLPLGGTPAVDLMVIAGGVVAGSLAAASVPRRARDRERAPA